MQNIIPFIGFLLKWAFIVVVAAIVLALLVLLVFILFRAAAAGVYSARIYFEKKEKQLQMQKEIENE